MKCTKKRDHVRCFFANLNLLFFCCSPSPLQKLPLVVIQKFCYHGRVQRKSFLQLAMHSGKLKLAFTSPDVISTSPKNFLTSRIDFTVLLLFKFLKKPHFPIGQVKNRIHHPDSKIH